MFRTCSRGVKTLAGFSSIGLSQAGFRLSMLNCGKTDYFKSPAEGQCLKSVFSITALQPKLKITCEGLHVDTGQSLLLALTPKVTLVHTHTFTRGGLRARIDSGQLNTLIKITMQIKGVG